jgi:O-antigen/teichoic acid export membrane protein
MSIRRHLAWMGGSQFLLFIFQFAGSVAIARLLSPYEMGIYSIAASLIGLINILQSAGLNNYIARQADITIDDSVVVFSINAILSILASILILIIGIFGEIIIKNSGVRIVITILSIIPLIGIFEFLPRAQFERNANFQLIAIINIVKIFTIQSSTIISALCGFSFISLAFGQILGSILSAVAYNIYGQRYVSLRLGFYRWRTVVQFAIQMLAISGVSNVAVKLTDLLLGRIIGLSALGLYSRATSLNNILWENVHLVIGRVLFVEFSATARSGKSLRSNYIQTVDMLTALLWPAFMGLAIIAGPFILNIYGPKWVQAAQPLMLLSTASVVLVSLSMTWEIFVVRGETASQARIEIIRSGAGTVLFAIGCFFGTAGAAASRIGEALISVLLYRPHLDRMTDTRMSDVFPILLRNAALTCIGIGPAFAVMLTHNWSPMTPVVYILGGIASGVAAWALALHLTNHTLAVEALSLVRRARARAIATG